MELSKSQVKLVLNLLKTLRDEPHKYKWLLPQELELLSLLEKEI